MISDFHIGAGSLAIDDTDVGYTTPDGVVVSVEPNVHLHMSGKFGMTPVKASLIGLNLTLKVVMAESVFNNMEDAMAGSVQADGKIKFGGIAGRNILGKKLTLTPFDGTPSWVFRNAVPTSNVEMAYQVENERVLEVTFTAMVDENAPEAENLAYVS